MSDDPPAVRIRWPREGDNEAPFEAGGGLAGHVDWRELLAHHDPPSGRFVFVAECRGEIAGVAKTTALLGELNVEVLARNDASAAARGEKVGKLLLLSAEALAWALGVPWLTLEALDEGRLIAYYEAKGFVRDGPPLFSAEWGVLHPMKKAVGSWP
jgi:GNAT superfamily N-acetyltransferase